MMVVLLVRMVATIVLALMRAVRGLRPLSGAVHIVSLALRVVLRRALRVVLHRALRVVLRRARRVVVAVVVAQLAAVAAHPVGVAVTPVCVAVAVAVRRVVFPRALRVVRVAARVLIVVRWLAPRVLAVAVRVDRLPVRHHDPAVAIDGTAVAGVADDVIRRLLLVLVVVVEDDPTDDRRRAEQGIERRLCACGCGLGDRTNRQCGGHTGCGDELRETMEHNCGILLAAESPPLLVSYPNCAPRSWEEADVHQPLA